MRYVEYLQANIRSRLSVKTVCDHILMFGLAFDERFSATTYESRYLPGCTHEDLESMRILASGIEGGGDVRTP